MVLVVACDSSPPAPTVPERFVLTHKQVAQSGSYIYVYKDSSTGKEYIIHRETVIPVQ